MIKADGLAAGKGVFIVENKDEGYKLLMIFLQVKLMGLKHH